LVDRSQREPVLLCLEGPVGDTALLGDWGMDLREYSGQAGEGTAGLA